MARLLASVTLAVNAAKYSSAESNIAAVRFGLVEVLADQPDRAAGEVAGESADGLLGEHGRGVPGRGHGRQRDGIDDDPGAVEELLADHAATVRAGRSPGQVDPRNVASSTWANTVTESRRASTGAAACAVGTSPGSTAPTSAPGSTTACQPPVGDRPQRRPAPRRRRQQRLGHGREHDGERAVVDVGGDAAAGFVHVGADRATGRRRRARREDVRPPRRRRRAAAARHAAAQGHRAGRPRSGRTRPPIGGGTCRRADRSGSAGPT